MLLRFLKFIILKIIIQRHFLKLNILKIVVVVIFENWDVKKYSTQDFKICLATQKVENSYLIDKIENFVSNDIFENCYSIHDFKILFDNQSVENCYLNEDLKILLKSFGFKNSRWWKF